MNAVEAPAEVVAPDDASSLMQQCKAIVSGAPCGRDASFRLLLACKTCGKSRAVPLCDWHERYAFTSRLDCFTCRHTLDVVGLEEL
jgi:hypothetical protein